VKAGPALVLAKGAVAAARNAQDLLQDAQVLAGAGRTARACSLAALAVEEAGKAGNLGLLAMMPEEVRARAPVGRMLEWHQLKQVEGLLIAKVRFPVAARLAVMPADDLELLLTTLDRSADEADELKRHGLYVDVDREAAIREPSEITEGVVISQLAQAERAVSAIDELLEPEAPALIVNSPPARAVELAQATVSALTGIGQARTPGAAVDVLVNAVSKLRGSIARNDAVESGGQSSMPDTTGRS
jgi:AbiV family abortive infection protein